MSEHVPLAFDDYVPVELRHRSDGWTAARQVDFLRALSESACVEDACRAVGKSPASAYALRRRFGSASFRSAWDAALDYGVSRLADAALSRALHGVARPVFYQGEQVGERRYFDERLTMFILSRRDPRNYGAWRDRAPPPDLPEDELACRAEERIEETVRDAEWFDGLGLDGPEPHNDQPELDSSRDVS